MSSAVTKLLRPDGMRNSLLRQIQRNMTLAGIVATTMGLSWWYFISRPRKIAYAEFHRHYDIEKDFQRKLNAGIFTYPQQIEQSMEELNEKLGK